MAISRAAISITPRAAASLVLKTKGRFGRRVSSLCTTSSSSSSPISSKNSRKLVLYSKPGCCLCDGLKEKLQAALTLSGPNSSINDVELQIRDISTNPEWEKAFQYEIPVLARIGSDGTEEILPRFSPRLGIELIHKKISAAFTQ